MRTIPVKNITLGGGKTAICAPLAGRTAEALRAETALAAAQKPDMLEWRADYFEHARDASACEAVLRGMHETLPDMPVLFTLRAAAEGGACDIPREETARVYEAVCRASLTDLIDIERANPPGFLHNVMDAARQCGVKVILSQHNFTETPEEGAILQALRDMRALAPDLVKIAVMPRTPADVLALLSALDAYTREEDTPAIAIAMGALGAVTRAAGGLFGSAVTYAALDGGAATAPGQLGVADLREVMWLLVRDTMPSMRA